MLASEAHLFIRPYVGVAVWGYMILGTLTLYVLAACCCFFYCWGSPQSTNW
jgi:hypothetical protein